MKRFLVLVLTLLATVTPSLAGEGGGFRDLRWGTDLAMLKDQGFSRIPEFKGITSPVESFKKKDDQLKIGAAIVDAITYNFLKGRLYSVAIDFNGYDNLQQIMDYCEKQFGKSTASMVKDMEYFISFDSPHSGALIYYQFAKHNFFVRNGRLFLYSRKMDPELMP